jgi:hypothetical protein
MLYSNFIWKENNLLSQPKIKNKRTAGLKQIAQ